MTVLTMMIIIAIAAFILWFAEELLREYFAGEDNEVIDLRDRSHARYQKTSRGEAMARGARGARGFRRTFDKRRELSRTASGLKRRSAMSAVHAAAGTSRLAEEDPYYGNYAGGYTSDVYCDKTTEPINRDTYNAA